MRKENPLLALHEALASALMQDLPAVVYETRDFAAEYQARPPGKGPRELAKGPAQPVIMKTVTRRPEASEVDVVLFSQMWGSTALGYGGLGGAAMTEAYTVVVMTREVACVYFGCGRLAYKVEFDKLTSEQRVNWEQALAKRQVPARSQAKALLGVDVKNRSED